MNTEIAKPIDFFDSLERYVREASTKTWVGTLLKYNKGTWLMGQDEDEVPLKTRFVVLPTSLMTGWLKWEDGHVIDSQMGYVTKGFIIPKRETLGDMDKSQWASDDNDNARDPWQKGNYVVFIDAETDGIFTLAGGSSGTFSAIGEVMKTYGPHARQKPSEVPVVELGTSSYKHVKYGKVHTPTLKVVGWEEQDRYLRLLNAATEDDVDEGEQTAPLKTKTVKQLTAPKATKAKATPPNKAKNNGRQGVRF